MKPLYSFKRLFILLTIIVLSYVFFYPSKSSNRNFEIVDKNKINKSELNISHSFIYNVYYYKNSKSLGNNAVAIVMVTDQWINNITETPITIIGKNGTSREISETRNQMDGVTTCRYITTVALTNTVENPESLEIQSRNGEIMSIPFKHAKTTAPSKVMICISPQFAAEQWQLFIMHVHISRHFGAHMHIYITSIIESYFKIMLEYEKAGYVTIQKWIRMKFIDPKSDYFDPNPHVEWRNQAGAQTDCLLQYKEAVDYIAFFDIDDLLFPKYATSYWDEINFRFSSRPNASYLYYERHEYEFIKPKTVDQLNFLEIMRSMKPAWFIKPGKFVIRPEYYNTTWIEFSGRLPQDSRVEVDSPHLIHVQNQKQQDSNDTIKNSLKITFDRMDGKLKEMVASVIQEDFLKIKKNMAIKSTVLPDADFYFPIIEKCYQSLNSSKNQKSNNFGTCPNADECYLPQRQEYPCIHSDANYKSGPKMIPFSFHYATDITWSDKIGC